MPFGEKSVDELNKYRDNFNKLLEGTKESIRNRITRIRSKKASNLIISCDNKNALDILEIVTVLRNHILGIKLHSDIYDYGSHSFFDKKLFHNTLKILSIKYDFIIIEDRKFCDIGNTVSMQSEYITEYADLITVHSVPGPGILEGLRDNCLKNNCGVLLISQMSSKDSLIDKEYTEKTLDMARDYKDIVTGFICQQHIDDEFMHFTPGVKLSDGNDSLGQQYNTPQYLIDGVRTDFLIVGRGIYQSFKNLNIYYSKAFMEMLSRIHMYVEDINLLFFRIDNINGKNYDDFIDHVKKYIYLGNDILSDSMIAKKIFEHNIVSIRDIKNGEEPFLYSSGNRGPGYVAIKNLVGKPYLLKELTFALVNKIYDVIGDNRFDFINGNVTGGMIYGWEIMNRMSEYEDRNIPFVYLRSEPKEGGHKELITGNKNNSDIREGMSVLIVEELINFGKTTIHSINTLRNEGYIVEYVACILSYNNKETIRKVEELGVKIIPLITLDRVLDIGLENGLKDPDLIKNYQQFLNNPDEWQKNN